MQQALLTSIQELFSHLDQGLQLLDFRGQSLVPAGPTAYYLPLDMQPGEHVAQSGYLFWRLRHEQELYLICPEGPTAQQWLRLTAFGVEQALGAGRLEDDPASAWRRLLTEQMTPSERDALLARHHIAPALPRQVLRLYLPKLKAQDAWELLRPLVPLDEQDVLTPLSRDSLALVKAGGMSQQDLGEFAAALCDTVREETGLDLYCGIGDPALSAETLLQSCQQAQAALRMGAVFCPKASVSVYQQMLLPRFLWELPDELAQRYHALLFNKRSAHLFTQEMLETIDMFLQKDLNLSDTARQLYIHRNTLVYRLDKVQRLSGLDLRRFDDAFIFKLLYDLRKSRRPDAGDTRKAAP